MRIDNIFAAHTWGIKKFLRIILSVQLLILGAIGLEFLGLSIPLLRQVIGFIYLTFIPGILILRILKMKNISDIESILYTIGLSIAALMFTGFLMNTIYPVFGITNPLSFEYILITISAIVFFLSVLSYARDEGFDKKQYLEIENTKLTLFLLLIPILIIIGTYLMNLYNIYLLILLLLIIISLISVIGLFNSFNSKLYPLAIFIIAISLLYHNSLISMYIWGWDINVEFYLANLVVKNAYWISTVYSDTNSMLSVVMLAPIYSSICNLSIEWVFKIIYPFLFSMAPLGLYAIIKKYTSPKIGFLSVFYFMAVYMFYCDMLQLARQEIAEVFFVLLILLMISDNMSKMKRSFLFIIFGTSLIVSHYGLSYIYMFYIILTTIILYLINKISLKDSRLYSKLESRIKYKKWSELTLTINFALLFVIFGISWYMYTSSSSPLVTILTVFDHIFSNILTEFLSPDSVQGLSIATSNEILPFHQLTKYLFLVSQFLVVIGITSILSKKTNFGIEYRTLSLLSFLLAILALVLPYVSSSLQTSRFYQITLLTLSPFFVLGSIKVFNIISKITKVKIQNDTILKITAIFLVFFFLFNSGVVYKITGEIQPSMSLIALDKSFDYPVFNEQEVSSAEWLSCNYNNYTIYSDAFRNLLLFGFINKDTHLLKGISGNQELIKPSFLYLGSINVKENKISFNSYDKSPYGSIEYAEIQNLSEENKLYDNQGSEIYLVNNTFNPSLIPLTK